MQGVNQLQYLTQNQMSNVSNFMMNENLRRIGSKSPPTHQKLRAQTPKSVLQNYLNRQNLQSIKDSISNIQLHLIDKKRQNTNYQGTNVPGITRTHKGQKLTENSELQDSVNKNQQDKSFFMLIQEQLKQLNKLQNTSNNNLNNDLILQINKKVQKRNSRKSCQISTPTRKSPVCDKKNERIFITNSRSQTGFDINFKNRKDVDFKINASIVFKEKLFHDVQTEEMQKFTKKIQIIQEKQTNMLEKLRERYKDEKRRIIQHYENQAKVAREICEDQIKKKTERLKQIQTKLKTFDFSKGRTNYGQDLSKHHTDLNYSQLSSSSSVSEIYSLNKTINQSEQSQSSDEVTIENKHFVPQETYFTEKQSKKKKNQKVRFQKSPVLIQDSKKISTHNQLNHHNVQQRYKTEEELSLEIENKLQEMLRKNF